jgi:hypothetical protein
MNTKLIFALVLTLSILTACAQPTSTSAYPPPGSTAVPPTAIASYPEPTTAPTDVVSTPTPIPVDLTPAQMGAVKALSDKYNIPVDQIKIIDTEEATWPNGCLGVVLPGIMCTDAIVDGFRIIMEANGQQFEFRTNQDGTNVVDAAQQLATLGFVVSATDQTIQVVNPNIPLGPTYNPAFNGFLPTGGSLSGTAYVLDFSSPFRAVAVNVDGQQDLPFINNPNYGLAVWHGGPGHQPMLAWGTQVNFNDTTSTLQVANLDGSNLRTILTNSFGTEAPVQLVAQLWSADGQSLYFSKEPVGLGGYILFSGASNLYMVDIATGEVSEIIPQTPPTSPQTCLDAISGDYRYVADHCTPDVITIRDLQNGGTNTIQAPADVVGYRLMGSARFSPDGSRVAFALAQGDPSNERGWVALGDRSGGPAKLILVGDAGSSYTVQGWLDDQTLLVQSNSIVCDLTCGNELFTVAADGSNPTKVAEGSFLTIIDNR